VSIFQVGLASGFGGYWRFKSHPENYRIPLDHDALEGWIADPKVCGTGVRPKVASIRPVTPTLERDKAKETVLRDRIMETRH